MIAEYVINEFTRQKAVALCVHDSFIVNKKNVELLKRTMKKGFMKVTGGLGLGPEVVRLDGTGIYDKWFEPIHRRSYIAADWADKLANLPFMRGTRFTKINKFANEVEKNYYAIE